MHHFFLLLWALSAASLKAAPLEPPKTGLAPAPIHSDALKVEVVLKTKWPVERSKPKILRKTLYLNWDGLTLTPRGHHYPELFVELELAVPVGTQLNTQVKNGKPLKPTPLDQTHDYYRFRVPIQRMKENRIEFFARFENNEFAEFLIDSSVTLSESVSNTHQSCDDYGLQLTLVKEGAHPTYFFARCEVEGDTLYFNALKAKDELFTLYRDGRKFFETYNQPVARFVLPQTEHEESVKIADIDTGGTRYALSYRSPEPGDRAQFFATFGFAGSVYRETPNALGVTQFLADVGGRFNYALKPRRGDDLPNSKIENQFETRFTLVPAILSTTNAPAGVNAARWWTMEDRLAFGWKLFPDTGGGTHYFWVMPGVHFIDMIVKGGSSSGAYGFGFKSGLMLRIAMTHEPYSRPGWKAYADFSTLLHFVNQNRTRLGFEHELDWFSEGVKKRRLSLYGEYAHVVTEKDAVKPILHLFSAGFIWKF